ncbi:MULTISPECIES: CBS domain-containing protein [Legionella]|uniref:CBS domain-containing protein n=1 Tax=Legionella resiliens TaxID=2905958 RepID=A0ABS8X1D9_9GAMM|nr:MULTISPECIES: CBS domain-containing protein [unclassified Legionella]MCE0722427.1 CBS domain-containing protein [Legionella sp. 9fVS26]MCE3531581.1 CBS domain-containing protein [Legionella sp. 8cVS16]QLZ67600.1 CBS domain-containing protein [Legionella sp. PC1000]
MQVKEIMTSKPEFLLTTATITEAAKKMRELDTGFLPIGDKAKDKIVGILTDRDLVISALANKNPLDTPVKNVMHKDVWYCFENDDVKKAYESMKEKQIRRLIVLNKDKKLSGVLSLGDIALHCDSKLSGETLKKISVH